MTDDGLARPEGFSWAYEDLHGHVRAHLAMIAPCRRDDRLAWRRDGRRMRRARPPTAPATARLAGGLTIERDRRGRRRRASSGSTRATGSSPTPPRRPAPASCSSCRCGAATRSSSPRRRRTSPIRSGRPTAGGSPTSATTRSGSSTRTGRATSGSSANPAGVATPRWSPDGRRLAFISRRRGWSQVWLVDAPVPRRGRPARDPRRREPTALTATGVDVEDLDWSPDGAAIAVDDASARPDHAVGEIHLVDVATGDERGSPAAAAVDTGAALDARRRLAVRLRRRRLVPGRPAVGRRPRADVLTTGEREHGEPSGGVGYAPLPSPDGSRFVHIEVHDGLIDLVVARSAAAPPRQARPRPAAEEPAAVVAAAAGAGVNPMAGRLALGRLAAGRRVDRGDRRERDRPQDLWLLPVPGVAPDGARPRQVTDSMPAVLAAALAAGRVAGRASGSRSRPATGCGSRARSGARPARPASAAATRVPTIVYPHGGPTWQAYRGVRAVQAAARPRGLRVPRRRLPRLDRLRPRLPPAPTTTSGATPTPST